MDMASRKVVFSMLCQSCNRAASSPFRAVNAEGRITLGCVDHFHTGHLVTPSESNFWHCRPEAKKIRAAARARRGGYVTEFSWSPQLRGVLVP
jgi:hypothetical protein